MAGRPRKPQALKVVAGTDRADRAEAGIKLPLIDEAPSAPTWLPNAHAKREFDRLAAILTANRLLTEGGVAALAMLCALHGKIVQLYAAGEAPNGAMMAAYRGLVNDFGLTPVAQGKVKPVETTPESNPFARNGQRKPVAS